LERPKPNEGYALKNDISNNSISQTEEKSTPSDEKSSDKVRKSKKSTTEAVEVTDEQAEALKAKESKNTPKKTNH